MMNGNPLDTLYDTVETPSLGDSHCPDHGDGSQRLQQSLQAEPPLSPWSSTADPDGMLSDCLETYESSGLEGASDNDREPSVSIGNIEYDGAGYSDFMPWEDETEKEEPSFARNDVVLGSLGPVLTDSQLFPAGAHLETSHAVPASPNTCAESSQATRDPLESFEQTGEQSRPGRPVCLKISTNNSGLQPPSIIISNNASDEIADGNPHALSWSHNSIDMLTGKIDMKEDATRPSDESMTPLQWSTRPGDLGRHSPNNYEMATQDRQPPDIPSGIDPRSEKVAVDSLSAFCADADLISADAVAATYRIDANLSRVKRRRLLGNHPVLQIPTNDLLLLQQWQKPSSNPPTSSTDQSRLQVPTYLTPPLSFQGSSAYQRHDSPFSTDSTLSSEPTPSPNRSMEPFSPFSRSPPSLTEADDGTTRCRNCADAVFAGPNQKNSLQRHQRDKHSDMLRLKCLVQGCTVTFAPGRKDNLLKHVRATHPDHPLPPSKKRKRKLDSG